MAYVYLHRKLTDNQVFYVGIGSDNKNYLRARRFVGRSDFWNRFNIKYGTIVEIIFDNITWEEALNKEIELIKLYGRINIKTGQLVNLTDGGDGILGARFSDEAKQKISKSNKGRKFSAETLARRRELWANYTVSETAKENMKIAKLKSEYKRPPHSEEAKIKMSQTKKSRPLTQKQIDNLKICAERLRGINRTGRPNKKPRSEEYRQKHRDSWAKRKQLKPQTPGL